MDVESSVLVPVDELHTHGNKFRLTDIVITGSSHSVLYFRLDKPKVEGGNSHVKTLTTAEAGIGLTRFVGRIVHAKRDGTFYVEETYERNTKNLCIFALVCAVTTLSCTLISLFVYLVEKDKGKKRTRLRSCFLSLCRCSRAREKGFSPHCCHVSLYKARAYALTLTIRSRRSECAVRDLFFTMNEVCLLRESLAHVLLSRVEKETRDRCNGCAINHGSQLQHACIVSTLEDKCNSYFESCIAALRVDASDVLVELVKRGTAADVPLSVEIINVVRCSCYDFANKCKPDLLKLVKKVDESENSLCDFSE